MAYIDREAFAEKIKKCSAFKKFPFEGDILQNVVLDLLGNQPTADVVEVVRCFECEHWNSIGFAENAGWCEKKNIAVSYDDFCSSGERRTG